MNDLYERLEALKTEMEARILEWIRTCDRLAIRTDRPVRLMLGEEQVEIPEAAGIYAAFLDGSRVPFYVGEAGDLEQRILFHLRAASRESTLRKAIAGVLRVDAPTQHDLQARVTVAFIAIPFGRRELEKTLHSALRINTGRGGDGLAVAA